MQVVCLTSHTEGTPNVVLEAMAAGRPVVATRVGGVPELIADGINGLLVEPGDVEGLARAITRLLNDPDLAQRLASAGQQMVKQKYGCKHIVSQLEQLYCDAVAAHRSGERE
jgi:glycosyltransferase involved in cell wall biosynthesis